MKTIVMLVIINIGAYHDSLTIVEMENMKICESVFEAVKAQSKKETKGTCIEQAR